MDEQCFTHKHSGALALLVKILLDDEPVFKRKYEALIFTLAIAESLMLL